MTDTTRIESMLSLAVIEDARWVVASKGRWQARPNLAEAVLALGCAPTAGVMLVSSDFQVDPVDGSVRAKEIERYDLDEDEERQLMLRVLYDKLSDVGALLELAGEYDGVNSVHVGEAEDALMNVCSDLVDLIE